MKKTSRSVSRVKCNSAEVLRALGPPRACAAEFLSGPEGLGSAGSSIAGLQQILPCPVPSRRRGGPDLAPSINAKFLIFIIHITPLTVTLCLASCFIFNVWSTWPIGFQSHSVTCISRWTDADATPLTPAGQWTRSIRVVIICSVS